MSVPGRHTEPVAVSAYLNRAIRVTQFIKRSADAQFPIIIVTPCPNGVVLLNGVSGRGAYRRANPVSIVANLRRAVCRRKVSPCPQRPVRPECQRRTRIVAVLSPHRLPNVVTSHLRW